MRELDDVDAAGAYGDRHKQAGRHQLIGAYQDTRGAVAGGGRRLASQGWEMWERWSARSVA